MRALLLVAVSGLLWPSYAVAGCSNYTDGSLAAPAPRVEICFAGKCETATVDFDCGNATGAQIGYSNGWRVEYAEGKTTVYRLLTEQEQANLTCTSDDPDACRFPAIGINGLPTPTPRP